jgi:NAD(P)-dependent dehydrogenase (short-subunit alcohol dehydrogenase family)
LEFRETGEVKMKRLHDRVALVTGSAAGVGRALAEALLKEGAKVALNDVNEGLLKGTFDELKGQGFSVHAINADISKREEVVAMKNEIIKHFGRVDILVNNAGGALNTPWKLEEIGEAHWNLVVDVNLKGAFFCCQAIIPEMVKQGGGAIVNISALAAHWRASLAGVQYTAAKAGVEGLTRQLAYDWGKAGIRVNAVAPTVTISGERVQSLWEGKSEEEVVVFLASDESSYVTGITIDVSGGRYLR